MRRIRVAMVPLCCTLLLSAAPVLTGCSDGPTSSGKCCKVCKQGKACGDTCIDVNATCNTPGGCACNG